LVAGEAAHNFETMPPTDAVSSVLQILRGESIISIIKIVLLQQNFLCYSMSDTLHKVVFQHL
jgi:hypothetical protein